ncbi:hypothetical protein H3U50_05380 [Lactobacillus sp. M0398]|uniref:hypothetical protein n=1 Tax=unclassified Lactobacillus TaxID=2620435 RepID=UPI0018DDC4EE|nr:MULTISPECIES: hypothetical protein [unclassified Lactobacillus]MBI0121253.1 hypothetical protein [Lactobacillus sp. M0398]MBI0123400.1 hypothetical protein [Lactobacillus sp. W8174]MBI0135535.1 hypothetical protein [Lactobacillus sp. W8173]
MNYQDYVELGLKDDGNLKLILKGNVENNGQNKIGVVSVIYITKDVAKAKQKISELNASKKGDYYMVYSCPLDKYLPDLGHCPSIEITQDDLSQEKF